MLVSPQENYLRMRGEYLSVNPPMMPDSELPPHARRIRFWGTSEKQIRRTTSACAENTITSFTCLITFGNYLRMRGEYEWTMPLDDCAEELPPHARRILGEVILELANFRTTSACAENTLNELGLL